MFDTYNSNNHAYTPLNHFCLIYLFCLLSRCRISWNFQRLAYSVYTYVYTSFGLIRSNMIIYLFPFQTWKAFIDFEIVVPVHKMQHNISWKSINLLKKKKVYRKRECMHSAMCFGYVVVFPSIFYLNYFRISKIEITTHSQ